MTMKTGTITFKLTVILLAITALLIGFSFMTIRGAWEHNQLARQLDVRNELTKHFNKLSGIIAQERGVGHTILGGDRSLLTKFAHLTREAETEIDEIEQHILQYRKFGKLPSEFDGRASEWRARLERLRLARQQVTGALIPPQSWFETATETIQAGFDLNGQFFAPIDATESAIYYNTILRPHIAKLAEYAGRERALIGHLLAKGNTLSAETRATLRNYRDRVEQSMEHILPLARDPASPRPLRQAIQHFEAVFLGDYQKLRQKIFDTHAENVSRIDRIRSAMILTEEEIRDRMADLKEGMRTVTGNALLAWTAMRWQNEPAANVALRGLIEAFLIRNPALLGVEILDASGQRRVRAERSAEAIHFDMENAPAGENPSGESFDWRHLPENRLSIAGMTLDRERGVLVRPLRPILSLGMPIQSEEGRLGTLIVRFAGQTLLEILPRNTMLVGEDGFYLHHPDQEKAWGMVRDLGREMHTLQRDFPAEATSLADGSEKIVLIDNKICIARPVYFHPTDRNRHWTMLRIIEPLPYPMDSSQWIRESTRAIDTALAISTDVGDLAVRSIQESERKSILEIAWAAGSAVLAMLVLFFLSRGFARANQRLIRIDQELRALASGDLTRRIPDLPERMTDGSIQDEIDHIANGINEMADNLDRTMRAIRENEAQLRVILENVEEGIIVLDAREAIMTCNPAAERIFGQSADALRGQGIGILLPEVTGSIRAVGGEIRGLAGDGRSVPLWISVGIGQWEDDVRYICLVSDMTSRKEQTQRLQEAKEEAENAARGKAEFLAAMSHEIRTPMNGVLGMAELLLEERLSPAQRGKVETIFRSGEALLALINDILDFSRIEAGKLTLDPTHFDLSELIKDVTTLFADIAARKGLRLETRIGPDLPRLVVGDGHRLRQILTNLLSNAVKFTERGHVSLGVYVQPEQPYTFHFHVQDTGIGIAEAVLARLFQPFTQADASVTRRFGGSGLGLSISRNLAEMMGGTVTAVSRPGSGSLFVASIPLAPGQFQEMESEPQAGATDAGPFSPESLLLVVEDDPINRQVMLGLLGSFGLSAEVAVNGRKALDCLREKSYDLVFMDCQMPEMDGFSACRRFRDMERQESPSRRTPVVALTAYALPGDRQRCLEAGMDDYLVKPIRKGSLHRTLVHWLLGSDWDDLLEPAPTEAATVVFDARIYGEMREEIGPLLDEIGAEFLVSLPGRLAEMRLAAEKGDWSVLERHAHTLKTVSAQFGGVALSELAETIEIQCREGQGAEVASLVETALVLGDRTREVMETLIAHDRETSLDKGEKRE
ncbi:MAG: response regulator [Magnetococcales bacterium]|nr:response regulator [Magnetococcales bacterium]